VTPGFRAIEPLLVQRLKDTVVAADPRVKILTRTDLAGVKLNAQPTPAVHVIPRGHTIRRVDGLTEIVETWLTVVVVRNAAAQIETSPLRRDASPLMDAVYDALDGWRAGDAWRALSPTTPPTDGVDATYGWFPLAWLAPFKKFPTPCPQGA
jgi:hypothetical protein